CRNATDVCRTRPARERPTRRSGGHRGVGAGRTGARGKILGFGHAAYRTGAPRSRPLLEMARTFDDPLTALAEAVVVAFFGGRKELRDQPVP
ncbi:MAG: hypothetical protein F2812_15120, partial [Actinobacteria bacterium]|nr:hypothetical protein [Actinomycetota bacterium]